MSTKKEHFFKPRARLLLQLGNQLIKDEGLALFELVKNSYDADATYSNVSLNEIDKKNIGEIIISDNGLGMNYQLVTNHWLEPGTDIKEKQIENFTRSNIYGRLPLGEKGIGRFGSHKLGQTIQLISKTDFDNEVEININWKDFENVKYLTEAPIDVRENRKPVKFTKSIYRISVHDMEHIMKKLSNDKDISFLTIIYTISSKFYILNKEIFNIQNDYKYLKQLLNKCGHKTSGTYIKISLLWENWSRGMLRNTFRSVNAINSPFAEKDNDFKVNIKTTNNKWLDKLLTTEEAINKSLFRAKGYIENNKIYLDYNFIPYKNMDKLNERNISHNFFLETV
jgi:hypothetical protein